MFVELNSEHWKKVAQIVASEKMELYDLELLSSSVRVTISGANGVKSEDCTRVCKRLLVQSAVEDLGFNSESNMEVNSPGVNRRLRVLPHYESAVGQNIKVLINTELIDSKEQGEELASELIGILKEVDSNQIVVEVSSGSKKKRVIKDWTVPLEAVKKARIDFKF